MSCGTEMVNRAIKVKSCYHSTALLPLTISEVRPSIHALRRKFSGTPSQVAKPAPALRGAAVVKEVKEVDIIRSVRDFS